MGNRKHNRVLSTAAATVIEALEGRRLLSASLELQGGLLTVNGSAANDTLIVTRFPDSTRAEYHTADGSGATATYFEPVTAIQFNGGGGADSIIVSGDVAAPPIPLTVTGPAGQSLITQDGGYQVIDGLLGNSSAPHANATLNNGVLQVTGTDANDEMYVGIAADGAHVFVRVNAEESTFDLAGITGVQMDGGAGDDVMAVDNYHGALHLPVTLLGGAGNDLLMGPSGRGHLDDITVDLNNPGPMPTTLIGGEGDDTLCGGLDTDQLQGDTGADIFRADPNDVVTDPDAADNTATDTGQGGNELPVIAAADAVYFATTPTPGVFATHHATDDSDSILA